MGCLSSLYLPCEKHSPKAAQSFSGGSRRLACPPNVGSWEGQPVSQYPTHGACLGPEPLSPSKPPQRGRPFTGACSHPIGPLLPGHPPSPRSCLLGPDWPTSPSAPPPALSHLLLLAPWLAEDLSPAQQTQRSKSTPFSPLQKLPLKSQRKVTQAPKCFLNLKATSSLNLPLP